MSVLNANGFALCAILNLIENFSGCFQCYENHHTFRKSTTSVRRYSLSVKRDQFSNSQSNFLAYFTNRSIFLTLWIHATKRVGIRFERPFGYHQFLIFCKGQIIGTSISSTNICKFDLCWRLWYDFPIVIQFLKISVSIEIQIRMHVARFVIVAIAVSNAPSSGNSRRSVRCIHGPTGVEGEVVTFKIPCFIASWIVEISNSPLCTLLSISLFVLSSVLFFLQETNVKAEMTLRNRMIFNEVFFTICKFLFFLNWTGARSKNFINRTETNEARCYKNSCGDQ